MNDKNKKECLALVDEQVKKLRGVSTALATDALRRMGVISGWTKGVYPLSLMWNNSFVGRAVTLNYGPKERATGKKMPGQFDIARALKPGEVLVFAARGTQCWLTGDNIATIAKLQGASAVICDGNMRDIADVAKLNFPFFGRGGGVKPYNTELALLDIGCKVEFAGAEICQGDIIIGDLDGIVVVPKDRVDEFIYQVEDIPALEENVQKLIYENAPVEKLHEFMKTKMAPRS